jgi:hypothetical protein
MRVVVADATPLHYLILQRRGLAVTGTLGVLDLASRASLLDLHHTFARLQKTNFRYPPSVMEVFLEENRHRKKREEQARSWINVTAELDAQCSERIFFIVHFRYTSFIFRKIVRTNVYSPIFVVHLSKWAQQSVDVGFLIDGRR